MPFFRWYQLLSAAILLGVSFALSRELFFVLAPLTGVFFVLAWRLGLTRATTQAHQTLEEVRGHLGWPRGGDDTEESPLAIHGRHGGRAVAIEMSVRARGTSMIVVVTVGHPAPFIMAAARRTGGASTLPTLASNAFVRATAFEYELEPVPAATDRYPGFEIASNAPKLAEGLVGALGQVLTDQAPPELALFNAKALAVEWPCEPHCPTQHAVDTRIRACVTLADTIVTQLGTR